MKTLLKNFAVASLSLGTVALSLTAGFAQAVTLAALFDGGSITVFDKVFDNWEPIDLGNVDVTQIDVTPLADDHLNPGLKYTVMNDALKVSDTNSLTLIFEYNVSTTSGLPLIKDNSLALTEFSFMGTGGLLAISESVNDAAGNDLGSKLVFFDNSSGVENLTDSLDFDPQSSLLISKNIFVGGDNIGDMVNLTMFEQRFSQVPEPLTMLGAATAAGFGAFFKRELNNKKKKEKDSEQA